MYPKEKEYTYLKTGNTSPVFLDPQSSKSRAYIDTDQGDITLLYCMDDAETILHKPSLVEWLPYEGGCISENFATELYGPPTAVRMYIKNVGNSKVNLKIIQ